MPKRVAALASRAETARRGDLEKLSRPRTCICRRRIPGRRRQHVPSLPILRYLPDEERPEALLRERSVLYVASSRTRDALVVTWSGRRSGLLGVGSSG
jgi:hypothetical protein